MSDITLTRSQLASFLPDQESIIQFENLFRVASLEGSVILEIIEGVGLNTDGSYIPRTTTNYLNNLANLYREGAILDDVANKTITGAGLGFKGAYVPPQDSNYLDASTSLSNANLLLDSAIANAVDEASKIYNFSFNKIVEPITIPINQQMAVFGVLELDEDITLDGELILKA